MMLVLLMIFFAFVLGVLAALAVEAVGVVFLIRWLNRKVEIEERKAKEATLSSATNFDISGIYNRQGFVWVLESTKVPKGYAFDKGAKKQKPKNDILEVMPLRKYAKIKDHSLILTEPDSSQTKILLKGCKIEAVSATGLPSRKWAKRFPVKVESSESEIYKGCKLIYVYLETSCEKESWCKALRLASCDDKEKLKWFSNLSIGFQAYVTSLNAEYPTFLKPSLGISADTVDRSIKFDNSSSKVRQFLKRLAKKASKSGIEVKANPYSVSSGEERKRTEKSYSFGDLAFAAGLERTNPAAKHLNPAVPAAEGNKFPSSSSTSDKDPDDRIFSDEGTLCWNLLISRLFFDAKNNMQMKSALQSRIQRTLSNMRSPSYVGEITCTSVDCGNIPPYIHGMRVLPSNMNEAWAFEIDIEYAGGVVLGIETRLEVQELDSQDGEELNMDSSSVDEVTSDLLEGIEYYGKQLNASADSVDELEPKDERDHKPDDNKSCKVVTRASSQVSKWKSMLHSVAKQVSQVPLALGIKVASLRGTVQLYIKPPPSDQIWFGFTSMPEIDFNLESFVGDHKITSGHLALFLISRFKAAIRESLVLPNCESAYIPWMLAEKDDWVPRKVAPFIWINQDGAANTIAKQEAPISQLGNLGSQADEALSTHQVVEQIGSENGGPSTKPISDSLEPCASSAPTRHSTSDDQLLQDLRTPLLESDKSQESIPRVSVEMTESHTTSQSLALTDEQSQSTEEDDARPQKPGTRARFLGLRKKMGEKLEEKRRTLEEKGRNIVEKMREHRN